MAEAASLKSISAIKPLTEEESRRYIPPLSDYIAVSPGWQEAEYRHFEAPSSKVVVGFWRGEPGKVTLDPWPYTEVCSVISGRVAIRDSAGRAVEFVAGQSFLVPKGFRGDWVTLEPASKLFIAIS